MVEALHAVEPCILDSSPWSDILTEYYPGSNLDFLKGQHTLWPRLVRLPRLISDVIDYNRLVGTDADKNRMLQQRRHELHRGLDISSFERSSIESLQLEFCDSNAGGISRTYGVVAATSYFVILTATNILIDRGHKVLHNNQRASSASRTKFNERVCTPKTFTHKLWIIQEAFPSICT